MTRAYNFGAGPAMIPTSVMESIRDEFLDYQGTGCSIIELSHRGDAFLEVIYRAEVLFRELAGVPKNYKVLLVHGGATQQFSAIPLNLLGRKPARKAQYVRTGVFAKKAEKEAQRYGKIEVLANGEPLGFKVLPEIDPELISRDSSYVYMTSNNTIYGSQWQQFPDTGEVPLVIDATSEMLSRVLDYSKFGLIYGGLQKNLGPSGMAVVCIREDLLGYADAITPTLLNYETYAQEKNLINTTNTFAVYVLKKILEWLKAQGGVGAIEKVNQCKAKCLYEVVDRSSLYLGVIKDPRHRSIMNVTFNLAKPELEEKFCRLAKERNLVALEGHRSVGGFRASIYNAMPMEGVLALAEFMQDFEQKES